MRLSLSTLNAVFASHPSHKDDVYVELGGPEGVLTVQDVGVIPYGGGEVVLSRESFVMGDTSHLETDYSDHPTTIGEARVGDWTTWSPRDALIATLRQIDSGEINVKSLVMVRDIVDPNEPKETMLDTRVASPNGIGPVVGLLELGKMHLYKRSGD